MKIKQYNIYLADLEPSFGSEPGKIRPVVVIQTDMLNDAGHKSTLICPLTTQILDEGEAFPLRIYVNKKIAGLKEDSDILVDQIRAIDNHRFIRKIGKLSPVHKMKLIRNLKIILFE
jgi:mRNA interferase MazF